MKIDTDVKMWIYDHENEGKNAMTLENGQSEHEGEVKIYKHASIRDPFLHLNEHQFRQMLECGRAISKGRTVLILGGEVK